MKLSKALLILLLACSGSARGDTMSAAQLYFEGNFVGSTAQFPSVSSTSFHLSPTFLGFEIGATSVSPSSVSLQFCTTCAYLAGLMPTLAKTRQPDGSILLAGEFSGYASPLVLVDPASGIVAVTGQFSGIITGSKYKGTILFSELAEAATQAITTPVTAPEPSTLALIGGAALALSRKLRKKAKA